MESNFLSHIEKIIQQRSTTEPYKYLQNLEKLKELIRRKIKQAKEEHNSIKEKYQILKKNGMKELPEIGHDEEWARFYLAWANFYKNREQSKKNNNLEDFHRQISDKLEKQTQRLKKLQNYSSELRNSIQTHHETNSQFREKKISEVDTIIKRFNFRIKNEYQKNYDEKIIQAREETQRLSESLATLNAQKIQTDNTEKELRKSNYQAEVEIVKIEEDIKTRENATNQSWDAVKQGNLDLKNRISSAKYQIVALKCNIQSIDTLLNAAQRSLNQINKSQTIISKIASHI